MGRDKHENEDLIKYGWPEDIWFHVDKMSSAHVYLRLPEGQTIDDIPLEALVDCAQLTKANSIQGSKVNNVAIVYTPWSNLKKTSDMDVGQVGFHKNKLVKTIMIEKKSNEMINRLNKTKQELDPNFRELREERDRKERLSERKKEQEIRKQENDCKRQQVEEAEARSYDKIMKDENMISNKDNCDLEDDFM